MKLLQQQSARGQARLITTAYTLNSAAVSQPCVEHVPPLSQIHSNQGQVREKYTLLSQSFQSGQKFSLIV
jgi:hypothetical protein